MPGHNFTGLGTRLSMRLHSDNRPVRSAVDTIDGNQSCRQRFVPARSGICKTFDAVKRIEANRKTIKNWTASKNLR